MKDFTVQVVGTSEQIGRFLAAFPNFPVLKRVSPEEIHVGMDQSEETAFLEWLEDGMTTCILR